MAILGPLLRNRRNRDAGAAWNRPNLSGPDTLVVTSPAFDDGTMIPREYASERAGGRNLSPALSWSTLPATTTDVLLVVEDLDAPISVPFIHCLALLDPSRLDDASGVAQGALSDGQTSAGVHVLRSSIRRGYQGPEPLKGHGPHRYVFQVFALTGGNVLTAGAETIDQAKPYDVLSAIASPVLARGRLSGLYER
jgi:Raf kinase inhibitor-like YbhB/YbcL family protein